MLEVSDMSEPNEPTQGKSYDVERIPQIGHGVVNRTVNAPPDAVWSVLADGWMYGMWVVGASRIREVDPDWPRPGSRNNHSVGQRPALINDHTEVLSATPGSELLLKARAWPAGEAHVRLTIEPARAEHSTIRMVEDITAGPGRIVPRPARQLLIIPRNTETLRRLGLIAEGRYRERTQHG
jgi:hypothetical protein